MSYTPLSPNVPIGQKRIEVNLTTQTLTCYEADALVFSTKVSTGQGVLLATPTGPRNITVKLPSRNMSTTSPLADDIIPLVGVPWTSFFTAQGHAFHGTYWHNNFGYTISHGCVNMRNEDALWLFRWSQPTADFEHITPGNPRQCSRLWSGCQHPLFNMPTLTWPSKALAPLEPVN